MASKRGIVIDVGFQGQWKEFVQDIEREFSKIDFDKYLTLDESFKKQIKDVRGKISDLSREIDEAINGKFEKKNPLKQITELQASVSNLSTVVMGLTKAMPNGMSQQYSRELDNIRRSVNEVTTSVNNAQGAISELASGTNSEISFVNKEELKRLEDAYKYLEKVREYTENAFTTKNKQAKKPYQDAEDAVNDLRAFYNDYISLRQRMHNIEQDQNLSDDERSQKISDINSKLAVQATNVLRLIQTYSRLSGKGSERLKLFEDSEFSLKKTEDFIAKELDKYVDFLQKEKARIQGEYNALGGNKDLRDLLAKGTKKESEDSPILIKASLDTKSEAEIRKEVIELIDRLQTQVDKNPLYIEVQLASSSQGERNRGLIKEILNEIDNIKDGEMSDKLRGLIDKMNRNVDNALLFNVKVNTETALSAIRKFKKDVEDELQTLKEEIIPIEPEVVLTEEHKEAFQKQLQEAQNDFTVNVGLKDGDELINNTDLAKQFTVLKKLAEYIDLITEAIKKKTDAFLEEHDLVEISLEDECQYLNSLYGQLILVEDIVKEIGIRFTELPTKFDIDISQETLDKLSNVGILDSLSKLKSDIGSRIFTSVSNNFELSPDVKQNLIKDIDEISGHISKLFEISPIQTWSNEFVSALKIISGSFDNLVGRNNNSLANQVADIFDNMSYSDVIMSKYGGQNGQNVLERGGVITNKGIKGFTYDQHGSTRYPTILAREIKKTGEKIIATFHSHANDNIVASSLPQYSKGELRGADLVANYSRYITDQIEKNVTLAINDIEVFDAKGFYDSNEGIDWNSKDIQEKIANKQKEIFAIESQNFYKYLESFYYKYGNQINSDKEVSNNIVDILKSKTTKAQERLVVDYVSSLIPEDIINSVLKNSTQTGHSFSRSVYDIISKSFSIDDFINNTGLNIDEANAKNIIIQLFNKSMEDINNSIESSLDIAKYSDRDKGLYIARQNAGRILSEALVGTGYKNNYDDYMKNYTHDEFRKLNPLGLDNIDLENINKTTGIEDFYKTLSDILNVLKEIKENGLFNFAVDNEAINQFSNMLESVYKNSQADSLDTVEKIDSEIDRLNKEISESQKRVMKLQKDSNIENSEISDSSMEINIESSDKILEEIRELNDKKIRIKERMLEDLAGYDEYQEVESKISELISKLDNYDFNDYIGSIEDLSIDSNIIPFVRSDNIDYIKDETKAQKELNEEVERYGELVSFSSKKKGNNETDKLGEFTRRDNREIGVSYDEYLDIIDNQMRGYNWSEKLGFLGNNGKILESLSGFVNMVEWLDTGLNKLSEVSKIIHLHPVGGGESEIFSPADILEYFEKVLANGYTIPFELRNNGKSTTLDFSNMGFDDVQKAIVQLNDFYEFSLHNLTQNGGDISSTVSKEFGALVNSLYEMTMREFGGKFTTDNDLSIVDKNTVYENYAMYKKYNAYARANNNISPSDAGGFNYIKKMFEEYRNGKSFAIDDDFVSVFLSKENAIKSFTEAYKKLIDLYDEGDRVGSKFGFNSDEMKSVFDEVNQVERQIGMNLYEVQGDSSSDAGFNKALNLYLENLGYIVDKEEDLQKQAPLTRDAIRDMLSAFSLDNIQKMAEAGKLFIRGIATEDETLSKFDNIDIDKICAAYEAIYQYKDDSLLPSPPPFDENDLDSALDHINDFESAYKKCVNACINMHQGLTDEIHQSRYDWQQDINESTSSFPILNKVDDYLLSKTTFTSSIDEAVKELYGEILDEYLSQFGIGYDSVNGVLGKISDFDNVLNGESPNAIFGGEIKENVSELCEEINRLFELIKEFGSGVGYRRNISNYLKEMFPALDDFGTNTLYENINKIVKSNFDDSDTGAFKSLFNNVLMVLDTPGDRDISEVDKRFKELKNFGDEIYNQYIDKFSSSNLPFIDNQKQIQQEMEHTAEVSHQTLQSVKDDWSGWDDWIGDNSDGIIIGNNNGGRNKEEIPRPGGILSQLESKTNNLKTVPKRYISGIIHSIDTIEEQLKEQGVPESEIAKKAQEIRNAEIESIGTLADGYVRLVHRTSESALDGIKKSGLYVLKDALDTTTTFGDKIIPKNYDFGEHRGKKDVVVMDLPAIDASYIDPHYKDSIDDNQVSKELVRQRQLEEEIFAISGEITDAFENSKGLENQNELVEKLLKLAKEYASIVGSEDSYSNLFKFGSFSEAKNIYGTISNLETFLNKNGVSSSTIIPFNNKTEDIEDVRNQYAKFSDEISDLGESYYESEKYANELLDVANKLVKLTEGYRTIGKGFITGIESEEIDNILSKYPELSKLYDYFSFADNSDMDNWMDKFFEILDSLPRAKEFMSSQNRLSDFINYDESVNSDSILIFDSELKDLNSDIQEATGSLQNYSIKYKEIFDLLEQGSIEYKDAMRLILEQEFSDYDIFDVGNGFQLLPNNISADVSDNIKGFNDGIDELLDKSTAVKNLKDNLNDLFGDMDFTPYKSFFKELLNDESDYLTILETICFLQQSSFGGENNEIRSTYLPNGDEFVLRPRSQNEQESRKLKLVKNLSDYSYDELFELIDSIPFDDDAIEELRRIFPNIGEKINQYMGEIFNYFPTIDEAKYHYVDKLKEFESNNNKSVFDILEGFTDFHFEKNDLNLLVNVSDDVKSKLVESLDSSKKMWEQALEFIFFESNSELYDMFFGYAKDNVVNITDDSMVIPEVSEYLLDIFDNISEIVKMNLDNIKDSTEKGFVANLRTGKASNFRIGENEGFQLDYIREMYGEIEEANATFHSHSQNLTAAFSFDDLLMAAKLIEEGKSAALQFAFSLNDIAGVDLSNLSPEQIKTWAETFKKLAYVEIEGFGDVVKDDEAIKMAFDKGIENAMSAVFDALIAEHIPEKNATQMTSAIQKVLERLDYQSFDGDKLFDVVNELFEKCATKAKISSGKISDINSRFLEKYNAEYQEAMMRKAFESLKENNIISKSIDFNSIYKRSSFDEFKNNTISKHSNFVEDMSIILPSRDKSKSIDDLIDEELKYQQLCQETIDILKKKKEALLKSDQPNESNSQQQSNTDNVGTKTDAFKNEGETVNREVQSEIDILNLLNEQLLEIISNVDKKTEAFKNEEKIVGDVIGKEITDLDSLSLLSNAFNEYKKYYDDNSLDTEAGANAALAYFNAYKQALEMKINKKELQKYTIGNTDDLFTGNYSKYKNQGTPLDTTKLDEEIQNYTKLVNEFASPEVIKNISQLSDALSQMIESGSNSDKFIEFAKILNAIINKLSGSKSADIINKIAENIAKLKASLDSLGGDSKSSVLTQIESILDKKQALEQLASALKSTQKQIEAVDKAVSKNNDKQVASDNLNNYGDEIYNGFTSMMNENGNTVINSTMKTTADGLIKIVALIQDANDAFKKVEYTTKDGSVFDAKSIEVNDAALSKQIKLYQQYRAVLDATVEDAENIGSIVLTPDSQSWKQLVALMNSFGIEAENVERVIRNIDEVGQESFQIFTNDGKRTTLGMSSTNILFEKDEVFNASKTIKDFENDILSLNKNITKVFDKGDNVAIENFVVTLKKLGKEFITLSNLRDGGILSQDTLEQEKTYFDSLIVNIQNLLKDPKFTTRKSPEFLENLESSIERLNSLNIDLFDVDSTEGELREIIKLVNQVFDDFNNKDSKLAKGTNISKILEKIYGNLNKNSAMSKELKAAFNDLAEEIKSYGDSIPVSKMDEFNLRFQQLKARMEEEGKTGLNFFDLIGKKIKGISASLIAQYLSLQDFIRYFREAINTVVSLDTALTELRKVSDTTELRLQQSMRNSAETAKELGSTISDVVNATADWSRLGYEISDAEELARVTTLYVNVGDNMDLTTASESLISTLQGFQLDASEAESIIDKFNEVANNYAIDTQGIGEALQRSAASFNAANTSLSESIALVTTANAVVQDPESVGTTFKTLSARIRGASTELSDLGEEEDEFTQTTSKLRDLVMGLTGFDIMEDEDNFKSIYEILVGIGKEWDNLTDIEQSSLGEALAGKRNANVLYSVMQNIDKLQSAYATAEGSAGSAMREQENYEKSIQYSLDRFSASAQDFANNIVSSDFIKQIVDGGTEILEILNDGDSSIKNLLDDLSPLVSLITELLKLLAELTNQIGIIPTIFGGIGLAAGLKGNGFSINKFTGLLNSIEGIDLSSIFSKFNTVNSFDLSSAYSQNGHLTFAARELTWEDFVPDLSEGENVVEQFYANLDTTQKGWADKAVQYYARLSDAEREEFNNIQSLTKSQKLAITNRFEELQNTNIPEIWEDYNDGIDGAIEATSSFTDELKDAFPTDSTFSNEWLDGVHNALVESNDDIAEMSGEIRENLSDVFVAPDSDFDEMTTGVIEGMEGFTDAISGSFEAYESNAENLGETITGTLQDVMSEDVNAVNALTGSLNNNSVAEQTNANATRTNSSTKAEAIALANQECNSAMAQAIAESALTAEEQENTLAKWRAISAEEKLTYSRLKAISTMSASKLGLKAEEAAVIRDTAAKLANAKASKAVALANSLVSMGLFALGSFLITKFIGWIDDVIHKEEKMAEAAEEALSVIEDLNNELKSSTSKVDDIKDAYAELAQGVANVGTMFQNQGSLSNEEYEQFLDYSNQLAELYPELTKGYTDNGDAILSLSGSVDTIVGSLDNLINKEREIANNKILEQMPDVFDGYIVALNKRTNDDEDGLKALQDESASYSKVMEAMLNGGSVEGYNIVVVKELLEKMAEDQAAGNQEVYDALTSYQGTFWDSRYHDENTATYDFSTLELTDENKQYLENYVDSIVAQYDRSINYVQTEIDNLSSDLVEGINAQLETDVSFSALNDFQQGMIKEMVAGLDYDTIVSELGENATWDDLAKWINTNITQVVSKIDNTVLQNKIVDLMTVDYSYEDFKSAYDSIIEYLKQQVEDGIITQSDYDNIVRVYFEPRLEEFEGQKSEFMNRIFDQSGGFQKLGYRMFGNTNPVYQAISDYYDGLDAASRADFGNIHINYEDIIKADDAQEYLNQLLEDYRKEVGIINEETTPSILDGVNQIDAEIEKAFGALGDAYQKIFYGGEDGGFDASQIDNATLKAIEDAFDTTQEGLEDVNFDTEKLNEAFAVLGSGTATADEAQQAFNDLATEWYYATTAAEALSEANADIYKQGLTKLGVTNADEVIDAQLEKLQEYEDVVKEINNLNINSVADNIINSTNEELQKFSDGGNVNLNIRPVIDTSELIDAGWEEAAGDVATVFTSTFSNETEDIAVNFTPIIADPVTGEYKGVLSPSELQSYAEDVISGVREDDLNLQIGCAFKGEDAIEQAEAAAEAIHNLHEEELNYTSLTDAIVAGDKDQIAAIQAKIQAYYAEIGADKQLMQAMYLSALAAEQESIAGMDNYQDKCDAIIALANAYLDLADAESIAAEVEYWQKMMNGAYGGASVSPEYAKSQLEALANSYSSYYHEKFGEIDLSLPLDFSPEDTNKDSDSGSDSDKDPYVEQYEKDLEILDYLRENGFITEKEYVDQYRLLYEKYFKDKAGYEKNYYEEAKKYLDKLKELYDSASSAAQSAIQDEIDALEKKKDAETKVYDKQLKEIEKASRPLNDQIKAYEEEKDAIDKLIKPLNKKVKEYQKQQDALDKLIKPLNKEIDALNDELDALNEANEAREKAINLQKDQYELERAQNQRTKLVYNDSVGYHYETDASAIRDAQEQLDSDMFEKQTDAIQKQIDAIQDVIDDYEKQKDAIQDLIDVINDEIEAYEEKQEAIDDLIEPLQDQLDLYEKQKDVIERNKTDIEDYYDTAIEKLNKYKEQWEELAKMEERAQNRQILASLGFDIDEIKNMDQASFDDFKEKYLSVLNALYSNDDDTLAALFEENGGFSGNYLDDTINAMKELEAIDLTSVATAIDTCNGEMQTFIDRYIGIGDIITVTCTKTKQAIDEVNAALSSGNGSNQATRTSYVEAEKDLDEHLSNEEHARNESNSRVVKDQEQAISVMSQNLNSDLSNRLIVNDVWFEDTQATNSAVENSTSLVMDYLSGKTEETNSNIVNSTAEAQDELADNTNIVMAVLAENVEETSSDVQIATESIFTVLKDNIVGMVNESISKLDDLIKKAAEADKAAKGSASKLQAKYNGTTPSSSVSGSPTTGSAFANGTNYGALTHDVSAIRSEYGQEELTVYPNGTYEITDKPTVSTLPKGTVVFNNDQTKKIIANGKKSGMAFAKGTGATYTPLSSSNPERYALLNSFNRLGEALMPHIDTIDSNISNLVKNFEAIQVSPNATKTTQDINISIGDINLSGVNDVNSLSRAIINQLPNQLLQEIHKR